MHMEICSQLQCAWMDSALSDSSHDCYLRFKIDCSVKMSVHCSSTVERQKLVLEIKGKGYLFCSLKAGV